MTLAKAAASALFAFALALCFWELVARTVILMTPRLTKLPGGANIRVGPTVWSFDGFCRTSYGPEGFRDPQPANDGSPRVLVIGDSFTAAQQVSDEEAFCFVTQETLAKKGVKASFCNAGIPGGAPPRYIGFKDDYMASSRADLVVVQLDERDFTADYPGNRGEFLTEFRGGTFQIRPNPKHGNLPRVVQMLGGAHWIQSLGMASIARRVAPVLLGLRKGRTYRGPTEGTLPDHANEYVAWVVESLKAAYPNLVVVYIPQVDYFSQNPPVPAIEKLLVQACQEQEIPIVNVRSAYSRLHQQRGLICHGFSNTIPGQGHINKFGHRLLGEALAEELEPILKRR